MADFKSYRENKRKFAARFSSNGFILQDNQRFGRILFLAILIHMGLLIVWEISPFPSSPLKKMVATMLDVNLSPLVDTTQQGLALNIATQNTAGQSITLDKSIEMPPLPKPTSALPMSAGMNSASSQKIRKRTISAAAHQSKDAAYLSKWQIYVEEFGNSHYPQVALKNDLQGNIRLLVAVNKDGSLREVSVRQSSGSTVLDKAAIDLVLQAAPFEPLPPELTAEIEVLEIIRTWQFRGKLSTSG